jgi:CBS-domain-containing membrane protein
MTLDWRAAAERARRIVRNLAEGAVAGLGIAIAIGVMEWLSLASHYPLAIIPFATSIALVIGSPDAEPAQPRALIGGHLVAGSGLRWSS